LPRIWHRGRSIGHCYPSRSKLLPHLARARGVSGTDGLFGVGIFLGEEKKYFEPSPALIELIAGKVTEHKAIVDEKAAWLFLCGRDIFDKGVKEKGTATNKGYLLVQNEEGENLGLWLALTPEEYSDQTPPGSGVLSQKGKKVTNYFSRARRPGSSFPAIYWRLAPPPVET
jgi:hypothetical protein